MSEKPNDKREEETLEPSEKNEKENSPPLKPNKSVLYTIVKEAKLKEEISPKEEIPKEEKNPAEPERRMQKNVSTLYRIISSQTIVVKPVEKEKEEEKKEKDEDDGDDHDDHDGAEYENVVENRNSETEKRPAVAENATHCAEDSSKGEEKSKEEKKASDLKKSSLEIRISSSSCSDKSKKSKSILESKRNFLAPDPPSSKAPDMDSGKSNLAHFSGIRFSFLDPKPEENKSNEFVYDTIDESKGKLESINRDSDYAAISDSSGTENFYSSPRTSLRSRSISGEEYLSSQGEYVTGDRETSGSVEKSDECESELFYAASDVLNSRAPTPPFRRERDPPEECGDSDLEKEKLPEIPKKAIATDSVEYGDVDADDYCRHRREISKELNLNPKEKKAIVKVRTKINKAWKSMKNWMNEEKEARERSVPRSPTVDTIIVLREDKDIKEATEWEQPETIRKRSESPEFSEDGGGDTVAGPRFCFSNENIRFLDVERREDCSDCGTYVDMSKSRMADSSTDLFSGFTLLRKKRGEGSSGTSSSFKKCRTHPEGQNGFEELRRYIKQGGDFCKELSVILQERSEVENQYAKSLSKLSHKLLKTSKEAVGSVSEAWQRLGAEMETQSEIHRNFGVALSEEVVKPLKQLVESQHRIRKNVEGVVDKTGKILQEWRQAECKSKKQSFLCARENEKLQDTMLDVRNNRNASTLHLHHHIHKNVSEKESAKVRRWENLRMLDLKRKKAEESVKKADIEYYSFCVRAERSRLDWESAVTRGSHCFQGLEEERLACLKNLASCYLKHFKEIGPRLVQSCDRLTIPVETCDVTRDIQTVAAMKGSSQPMLEQLLPDFYAEHITLAMNRERRRQALVKLLQLIRQDLEREKRGKEGVENLQRALQQTPNFGAEESQQNVDEKLYHMKSMLIYLDAARYKVQSALTELDGGPKESHPLATHIHMTRDRQGLQQSVLRVPYWAKNESVGERAEPGSPNWTGREAGDGTSVQPDSDFDEFSSVGSDKDYQCEVYNVPIISDCNGVGDKVDLGRCRALYEYKAKVYDELNLRIGDVIKVHDKHPDGWWLGELDGVVGIFPATYVEEIDELTP